MQGFNALWLPGTDHASISTEVKIVDSMAKEGITKEQIGREAFLERAWKWKEQYGGTIIEQLKKLGSSCDWERESFTMDKTLTAAVLEVFEYLYNKGLIYRGEKLINWCPKCGTTISDAEVDHEDKDGFFWHFKYPVSDGSFLEFATTRPETMLGDTAIAVHPKDDRYKHLVGKTVTVPIVERVIPIIADEYVDMEFGVGVVKITPAHDPNDFEVGERHNLPKINIMNDDGTLNANAGSYRGLDRYEARKKIVEDFTERGLFIKVENHRHAVGVHERCKTVVEPLIKLQWFVKMEELAKPAINAYKTGELKFIPDRFSKIYLNWLENIHDWCISRQLWWGHRIPAYYCEDCGYCHVSKMAVTACTKCGSQKIKQDEDTLDTWFSSALWPFATLANTLNKEVTYNMDTYELGVAVQKIYDFIWDEFCDWYIEMVKPRLYNKEDSTRNAALWTLKTVIINSLKLLHPYMPFITEEIFTSIQSDEETIMRSAWPVYNEAHNYANEEKEIELIKEAIKGIRNIRTEMNVPPSKKSSIVVVSASPEVRAVFENGTAFMKPLAFASEIVVQQDKQGIKKDAVSVVLKDAVLYIPFDELVDISKEIERLIKEKEKLIKEVERVAVKLNNPGFTGKAPENVIKEEREKQEKYQQMLDQVEKQIANLKI
ncbi:valyl-trna synthetase [Holotrichia oblita]|nr:valyl-trna synthetase [Holotrichia oblita]